MTPAVEAKFIEAELTLPPDKRPMFRSLYEDYVHAAKERFGTGYVSYLALAKLVEDGWTKR